jgi:hypothetical protein
MKFGRKDRHELMAKKQIKIAKHMVCVEDAEIDHIIAAREIRAIVGNTTVVSRVTFGGGIDGPRVNMTIEQLQKDLDTARQKAAEEAAHRENVRELMKQVK